MLQAKVTKLLFLRNRRHNQSMNPLSSTPSIKMRSKILQLKISVAGFS